MPFFRSSDSTKICSLTREFQLIRLLIVEYVICWKLLEVILFSNKKSNDYQNIFHWRKPHWSVIRGIELSVQIISKKPNTSSYYSLYFSSVWLLDSSIQSWRQTWIYRVTQFCISQDWNIITERLNGKKKLINSVVEYWIETCLEVKLSMTDIWSLSVYIW